MSEPLKHAGASAKEQLQALKNSGLQQFDPIRICYMEGLASRADNKNSAVNALLDQRLQVALDSYHSDLDLAREEARQSVEKVASQFADSLPKAQELYDSHQFNAVRNLEKRLRRSAPSVTVAELIHKITHDSLASPESDPGSVSFNEYLSHQEAQIVRSTSTSGGEAESEQPGYISELKSISRFRESRAKMEADKLVSRAIAECPENAGPLNPQRLVIESLSTLRTLSPHYLNRFVSYIDTLLWLEKAAAKTGTSPGKPQ